MHDADGVPQTYTAHQIPVLQFRLFLVESPKVQKEEIPLPRPGLTHPPELRELRPVLGGVQLGRACMAWKMQRCERCILKRAGSNREFDDGRIGPAEPKINRALLDCVLCTYPGKATMEVCYDQRKKVALGEESRRILIRDFDERSSKLLHIFSRA